ncbi:hypothetical protein [Anaeroarcus burkinensis]|uniref:RipA family octameric membrane protein n=1 Tax=Anaeroarcus burkinensis TaxID=82376 RepID=UPI00041C8850|nr:hypothetical protein [Anaeroarcus burkinensis]
MTKEEYLRAIKGEIDSNQGKRCKSAFDLALDSRKFEIDLFWKRISFFWTFITVIYASYGALIFKIVEVIKEFKYEPAQVASFWIISVFATVLSILGLIMSFVWIWSIAGSSFWQKNWEAQVDVIENEIHGPIYKTIYAKCNIAKERDNSRPQVYPISMSKLAWFGAKIMTWFSLLVMSFSMSALIWGFCFVNKIEFYQLVLRINLFDILIVISVLSPFVLGKISSQVLNYYKNKYLLSSWAHKCGNEEKENITIITRAPLDL